MDLALLEGVKCLIERLDDQFKNEKVRKQQNLLKVDSYEQSHFARRSKAVQWLCNSRKFLHHAPLVPRLHSVIRITP